VSGSPHRVSLLKNKSPRAGISFSRRTGYEIGLSREWTEGTSIVSRKAGNSAGEDLRPIKKSPKNLVMSGKAGRENKIRGKSP